MIMLQDFFICAAAMCAAILVLERWRLARIVRRRLRQSRHA